MQKYATSKFLGSYDVTTTSDDIRRCCDTCRGLSLLTTNCEFVSTGDRETTVIEMAVLDDTLDYLAQAVRDFDHLGSMDMVDSDSERHRTWVKLRESVPLMELLTHEFARKTREFVRKPGPVPASGVRYGLQCVLNHADVVLPLFDAMVQAENDN